MIREYIAPVVSEDTSRVIEVNSNIMRLVAKSIHDVARELNLPKEEIRIKLKDGLAIVGTITLTLSDDCETYSIFGTLFKSPVNLTVAFSRLTVIDHENVGSMNDLYESGCSWSKDKAPRVKSVVSNAAKKLTERADSEFDRWIKRGKNKEMLNAY